MPFQHSFPQIFRVKLHPSASVRIVPDSRADPRRCPVASLNGIPIGRLASRRLPRSSIRPVSASTGARERIKPARCRSLYRIAGHRAHNGTGRAFRAHHPSRTTGRSRSACREDGRVTRRETAGGPSIPSRTGRLARSISASNPILPMDGRASQTGLPCASSRMLAGVSPSRPVARPRCATGRVASREESRKSARRGRNDCAFFWARFDFLILHYGREMMRPIPWG